MTDFWWQPLPTAAAVSPFCFAEYTSINFEMAEFILKALCRPPAEIGTYGTSHKKKTDFWRQPLLTVAAVSPFYFAEYTSIRKLRTYAQ